MAINDLVLRADKGIELTHVEMDGNWVSINTKFWVSTVNPAVTDDSTEGFQVGSIWINVTTDKFYKCTGNGIGTAVWSEIPLGGSGSSTFVGLTDTVGGLTANKMLGTDPSGLLVIEVPKYLADWTLDFAVTSYSLIVSSSEATITKPVGLPTAYISNYIAGINHNLSACTLANHNVIAGDGVIVDGDILNSFVSGTDHTLEGSDSNVILGFQNYVYQGYSNILIGDNNFMGDGTALKSTYATLMLGYDNRTSQTAFSSYGLLVGDSNVVDHDYCATIGTGLKTSGANQLILGQFNDNSLTGYKVAIGNGTTDLARASTFVVYDNGAVLCYDISPADIDNDKMLTTREYVTSHNGSTGATASRPASPIIGEFYKDTTLGIPIWWDGTNWINHLGTTV